MRFSSIEIVVGYRYYQIHQGIDTIALVSMLLPSLVSIRGISLTFFPVIGRRIIEWDLDWHQNIASNARCIFSWNPKIDKFFFYWIALDCIFPKSHFPTLCMVSQIASHLLKFFIFIYFFVTYFLLQFRNSLEEFFFDDIRLKKIEISLPNGRHISEIHDPLFYFPQ